MTIIRAKDQSVLFRRQQRELRKTIDWLRGFLRGNGIAPGPPAVDLPEQNKATYSRYRVGRSWEETAKEFRLAKERIKLICRRVEIQNEKREKREANEAL